MCEVVGQPAVLQGDPGVDEGGRSAVVVHEEVLGGENARAHRGRPDFKTAF